MALGNPNPTPISKKVFNILAPAGTTAAAQSGFNAARNYFPGVRAVPKIPQPLPVSQAIQTTPTAAQIVQQAAGVPRVVAAPAASLAAPIEQAAVKAVPQFALPASRIGQGASLALPGAEALGPALPAAVADAGGAASVVGNVAKKGRIAGLMSKVPFATPAEGAATSGILGTGGALAAGSIGRGLGYGAAGYLAGEGIQGITGEQSGTWDDAAQYGATGAGIGAGIGSVIFPGVGTAIGAGAGALLGGLGGALFGEDKGDDQRAREQAAKIDSGAKAYMAAMGVSDPDQTKILAQLQFQGAGMKGKDLQLAYNQLLPQYVDAANQIREQGAQNTLAEQQRTNRLAAIQGYLMPQLTGFLNTAQKDADQFSQANNNPAYGAMQAQTNAAYMSQLAALTQMSQGSAQPQQSAPTLDDYLSASLAQSQQADPQAQIDAIIAGKQAQAAISKQAKATAA